MNLVITNNYLYNYTGTDENIVIPASVEKIDRFAFAGCPGLTVFAPAGSHAEKYAKENGIPFGSI